MGANAELQATVAELMAMVKVLDALNQYRFEKDPDLLAASKTARKVRASGKARDVKAARSQVQA